MKKIALLIVLIITLAAAWYFGSPLIINKTVDEAPPIEIGSDGIPEDIIIDQDVTMEEVMPVSAPESVIEMTVDTRGSFSGTDNFHKGAGDLIVIQDGDKTYLRFENFSVTNGPDLFVTLNKNTPTSQRNIGEHVIVDALKGNIGDQNYDVSEYDLSDYDSVSIYCRNFSVVFATAEL